MLVSPNLEVPPRLLCSILLEFDKPRGLGLRFFDFVVLENIKKGVLLVSGFNKFLLRKN